MFNFEAYVVVVALVAAALWLLIGLGRLTHKWRDSQNRTAGLRQQKLDDAKALLKKVQEIVVLETELKQAKQRTGILGEAAETKKKDLKNIVPPPPPAVYVTSEFPPSSRDKAWDALLKRTGAKPTRADEPVERHLLVWAPDHAAAQGRAQSALAAYPGFTIDCVLRFT
jgi:hypothetical protein